MKKLIFIFSITLLATSFSSCKKKKITPTTTSATDPAIFRTTTTVQLAYNNTTQTDPMCFLDLDAGTVYSVSNAAANADKIDLVYVLRYSNANDPMFISIGDFDGNSGMAISTWDKTTLGISNFTTFNHTTFDQCSSSFTTANFNAITKLSELNAALGTGPGSLEFYWVDPTVVGNLFEFRTQQGKLGTFKLNSCQNGSTGFATIEIVIEK